MIPHPAVNRVVVALAAVGASIQGVLLWQLLVNTKPYKISLVASRVELVAVVGGALGCVAAVLTAKATTRRFVSLALPASAVMVPLAVLLALALTVGFAPDPSGTPPDVSPANARLDLLRHLWLLGLWSAALAALLSAMLAAYMRRGAQTPPHPKPFQRSGGDA